MKRIVLALSIVALLGTAALFSSTAFANYDANILMAGGGEDWDGG